MVSVKVDDNCAICLKNFLDTQWKCVELACEKNLSHIFHQKCLSPWINRHNTCPACRRYIKLSGLSKIKNKFHRIVDESSPQIMLGMIGSMYFIFGACVFAMSYYNGIPNKSVINGTTYNKYSTMDSLSKFNFRSIGNISNIIASVTLLSSLGIFLIITLSTISIIFKNIFQKDPQPSTYIAKEGPPIRKR